MTKSKLSNGKKRKAGSPVDKKPVAVPIRSLVLSPIVTILAGKERLKLHVHEHVLKNADSPAINTLLNGKWREAKEKLIDWSEFDSEIILCVVRFLYFKKYTGKTATETVKNVSFINHVMIVPTNLSDSRNHVWKLGSPRK